MAGRPSSRVPGAGESLPLQRDASEDQQHGGGRDVAVEEVARLAEQGKKNIAVCAPAFSADCIETLEEINEEINLELIVDAPELSQLAPDILGELAGEIEFSSEMEYPHSMNARVNWSFQSPDHLPKK